MYPMIALALCLCLAAQAAYLARRLTGADRPGALVRAAALAGAAGLLAYAAHAHAAALFAGQLLVLPAYLPPIRKRDTGNHG